MLRAWNSIAMVPAVEQREPAAFHLTSDKTSLQRSAKGRRKEDLDTMAQLLPRLLSGSILLDLPNRIFVLPN